MGERIIWGRNAVREAISAGKRVTEVIVLREAADGHGVIAEMVRAASAAGTRVRKVGRESLDDMVREVSRRENVHVKASAHQGIVAIVEESKPISLTELLEWVKGRPQGYQAFGVAVDSLQDPRNLGAIMRTADAVGVDFVLLPSRRCVGITATVVKASAGGAEHVRAVEVVNLKQALLELKEAGFWVMGLDASARLSIWEADFRVPLVLVIGGESKGLSRIVGEKCDQLIKIPMFGHVNSLNASVAAAVAMYEVLRQRCSAEACT
ncbi:MAG TPA: 23S rRNA (guanosine(2251)-2'-O)-methyltransferase RlmB [Firmicutes bacterium]|nr:23S rRNA (guanosine(2251)-2'-O)-methyltransferase RlmB [Bacillota bacterium]